MSFIPEECYLCPFHFSAQLHSFSRRRGRRQNINMSHHAPSMSFDLFDPDCDGSAALGLSGASFNESGTSSNPNTPSNCYPTPTANFWQTPRGLQPATPRSGQPSNLSRSERRAMLAAAAENLSQGDSPPPQTVATQQSIHSKPPLLQYQAPSTAAFRATRHTSLEPLSKADLSPKAQKMLSNQPDRNQRHRLGSL